MHAILAAAYYYCMQKSSDNLRIRMARIEAALDMDPASCGAPTTCTSTTTHNRLRLRLRRKTSTFSESGASSDTSTSSDSGTYSPPSPHYPSSGTSSSRTSSEAATGTASLRQHVNDVKPLAQVRHGVVTGSGRLLLPPFRGTGEGPRGGSSNKHDSDTDSESNSEAPIIVPSPRRHAPAVTQAVTVTVTTGRPGGRGASESAGGLAPALDSESDSESDLESSSYLDSDSAADKVLVVASPSPQADLTRNAQPEQGADLMLLTGVSTGSESRPSLHTNTTGIGASSQESKEALAAAPVHDVPMLHLPLPMPVMLHSLPSHALSSAREGLVS
jgi:hypothetical protein